MCLGGRRKSLGPFGALTIVRTPNSSIEEHAGVGRVSEIAANDQCPHADLQENTTVCFGRTARFVVWRICYASSLKKLAALTTRTKLFESFAAFVVFATLRIWIGFGHTTERAYGGIGYG